MPNDDAREIYSFLAEYSLLIQSNTRRRVGMGCNGRSCFPVRFRGGSQDPLYTRSDAGFVCRAFQDCGLHAGISNAIFDVAHKHFGNQLRPAKSRARATKAKAERDVVVRVDTRGDDDVDGGSFGDSLYPRDVAAHASTVKSTIVTMPRDFSSFSRAAASAIRFSSSPH